MTDKCCEADNRSRRDWVSNRQLYTALWGVPSWALVAGIFLPPPVRAVVWTIALAWKGLACLANARQCGRTHCYFTGPFFLIMALLVSGCHLPQLCCPDAGRVMPRDYNGKASSENSRSRFPETEPEVSSQS